MLRVEKVGAQLTPLSERICVLKRVQIEPRSTNQKKDYVGLPTDSFIGQGRTYDSLKIPSQYETYTTRGAP